MHTWFYRCRVSQPGQLSGQVVMQPKCTPQHVPIGSGGESNDTNNNTVVLCAPNCSPNQAPTTVLHVLSQPMQGRALPCSAPGHNSATCCIHWSLVSPYLPQEPARPSQDYVKQYMHTSKGGLVTPNRPAAARRHGTPQPVRLLLQAHAHPEWNTACCLPDTTTS